METETQLNFLRIVVIGLLGVLWYGFEHGFSNDGTKVNYKLKDSLKSLVPWRTEQASEPDGGWGSTRVHIPDWVFQRRGVKPMKCLEGAAAEERFPMDQLLAAAHAQNKEDMWAIQNLIYGCVDGLILESGAYDGDGMSTTHLFVHQLDWKAIHVEAAPRTYERLARNRPDAINIHTALCEQPKTLHWIERDSEFQGGVNGIFEFMAPSFLAEFYPGRQQGDASGLPSLSCRPITPWLQMYGLLHINVWVLDVEGAELDVLKAVDFDLVLIDVIFIEADRRNRDKDRAVIQLLQSKGYTYYAHVLSSDWFYRKGFTPKLKPGTAPPPTPEMP